MNTLTLSRATEAHAAKALRPTPAEPLFEIAWHQGSTLGPFASEEQAIDYALSLHEQRPVWRGSEQRFVDDYGLVYTIDAGEDGYAKHVEGEIREVRP